MISSAFLDDFLSTDDETIGRRGRKKRATAHRIFRSAIELMQQDGFHGVSIEQICERADVARATFFQHFANKAALMGMFTDVVCQRIDKDTAMDALPAQEQLRRVADHLQHLTDELGAVAPEMLSAFISEPGCEFAIDDPNTGVARLILGIVQKGQADGTFAAQWSSEDVAISIVASWVGVARRRVLGGAGRDGACLHGVVDLFVSGLAPR